MERKIEIMSNDNIERVEKHVDNIKNYFLLIIIVLDKKFANIMQTF